MRWLRGYQREAVGRIVEKERGIIWAPTGSGKTEIFTGATRAIPCKWLFVVHRSNLAKQALQRYALRATEHGLPVLGGLVLEGKWDIKADTQVVCASFQTITAALKKRDKRATRLLEWAEAIAIDEAHTLPSTTFYRVAMMARNARYRVGFSGTPLARGDQKSLYAIAALGPVIYRIEAKTLIDAEVLAKPTIRMVESIQVPRGADTWHEVYSKYLVHSAPRNALLVEIAKRAPKPAFLFVKEVDHGKLLQKSLTRAGLNVEFVWGSHSVEHRERLCRKLVDGDLDVLVCSVVFQEGIDVPSLRSVIVGGGGKSVIAALQRIGRGMRVERNVAGEVIKGDFNVYDVADRGCGCADAAKALGTSGMGLHRGCKWLDAHTHDRRKAYISESYETHAEQWVLPHT